jgi:hypothetical protein
MELVSYPMKGQNYVFFIVRATPRICETATYEPAKSREECSISIQAYTKFSRQFSLILPLSKPQKKKKKKSRKVQKSSPSIGHSLVFGCEESSIAGARAYSVREVARAGYLFWFVRQSAVAIAVPVTRSKPSA